MSSLLDRITVEAEKCGGRPCIRRMRIRVTDVLDLLASGLSRAEVLQELPDLEPDDVEACLRFASRGIDHPILARAALMQGRSLSDFVVGSAIEAAHRVIRESELLALSERDQIAFARAVSRPARPTAALRAAARRYLGQRR